jgi:hypothetical protein
MKAKKSVTKPKKSATKPKKSATKPKKSVVKTKKSATKAARGCTLQTTKKYQDRPSPSYPANECHGERMKGNDGLLYISKGNKNGVYKWVKVGDE